MKGGVRRMATKNNNISLHKCFFELQSKKIRNVINQINQKDSLSIEDTQAIRELLEIYDSLSNPVEANTLLFREVRKDTSSQVSP